MRACQQSPRAAVLAVLSATCFAAAVEQKRSFVILGAGPAGIQWGKLLEEAGESDYVILERNTAAGSFFQKSPRAQKLISANRANMKHDKSSEFGLRHDWHSLLASKSFATGRYSARWHPTAPELVKYLQDVADPLKIEYNTSVVRTEYREKDGLHAVHTEAGDVWLAEWLVVATGMRVRDVPECLSQHAKAAGVSLYTYDTYPNVVTADEEFCRGKTVV
eukprot:2387284-Rhodomonas_salina.1